MHVVGFDLHQLKCIKKTGACNAQIFLRDVKIEKFSGGNNFAQNHGLWVHVRTASVCQF